MIIRFTYYSMIQFFIVNINVQLVFLRINCKNKKNINGTHFLKKNTIPTIIQGIVFIHDD